MESRSQVEAARSSVLAVPERERATLAITGHDRVTWLNGLVTCDLVKGEPSEARYGLFVGRNGRILADAAVALGAEELWVAVPAVSVESLRPHLEHYLVMEDAEVSDRSVEFEVWSLHGPRSAEVLAGAKAAGSFGGALDRTGLQGALVFVPKARSEGFVTAVREAGGVVGDDAGWSALRLERAVPEYGRDFDETTYPQEAGLEKFAVSFNKGCYLGQEVVCMLELRGHVKRRLAALVLQGGEAPSPRDVVLGGDGSAAGEVTSAAFSPTLGRPIALAMLKRAFTEPGLDLRVASTPAQVVERPT
jgi:folate-binding protein YgfZ